MENETLTTETQLTESLPTESLPTESLPTEASTTESSTAEALTAEEQARQALLKQKGGARYVTITFSKEEEEQLWRNAQGQPDYNAVWKLTKERQQREEEAWKKQEWNRSRAKLLLTQLGHAYTAYTKYQGQSPQIRQNALEQDAENQDVYDQLRANLERANNAPRCAQIKASGERCRAPKARDKKFCHMHLAMQLIRPQKLDLPPLDDPNGIQLAIMHATQGLVDGTLDGKHAALLARYLQLAASNVGRVNFEREFAGQEYADDEE